MAWIFLNLHFYLMGQWEWALCVGLVGDISFQCNVGEGMEEFPFTITTIHSTGELPSKRELSPATPPDFHFAQSWNHWIKHLGSKGSSSTRIWHGRWKAGNFRCLFHHPQYASLKRLKHKVRPASCAHTLTQTKFLSSPTGFLLLNHIPRCPTNET